MTHFKVHLEEKRTICRWKQLRLIKPKDRKALRANTMVDCPKCMVLKDIWLSEPKRKPLTVRRRNILLARLKP